ncbi:BatA domain-containing protein [candidate division WOR-3 bacterium]|nr:BatA domain-containing protein [candidate division WOR-3 bacterium]
MTFLSPWVLIAGIFALLPVIIHLWFKKRLRRIPFSSLIFLKTAEAKRFGWLRLREILILISRCCFIACLVLSLARPRVQRPVLSTSRTASVILLVDNSYSMFYGNNFSRARTLAQQVIDQCSAQSEIMIVPLCRARADSTHHPFWSNKRSAYALLDAIDLTYKKGNVFDALLSCSNQEARYPVDRIYVGDGQAVAFAGYPDTMPPLLWVQLLLGHNCGLTRMSLSDPIAMPEETYDCIITVQNYGANRWDGMISLQGSEFSQEIPCAIDPRTEHLFNVTLPRTLRHGAAFLEHDSIVPDNAFYFSFPAPRDIRILIKGTNRFITNGLQTGNMLSAPFFIKNVRRLGEVDARSYDVIIICGDATLTPAECALLEHIAAQQTSSIICLLGGTIDPQMRAFLKPYCGIGDHIDPVGYLTLDWIDYDHPVFSIFRNDPTITTSKVYDYWLLSGSADIRARITDDHPFIISKNTVTIIGTDLMPQSTDLVYKTAFIPLLFRLIMIGIQPDIALQQTIGAINPITTPLKTPTGEFIAEGGEFLMPGLYVSGDTVIAVNVDPEEGNSALIGNKAAQLLHITPVTTGDLAGSDLNIFFLMCALAFLLFEVIMLLIR